jgi:hypothetical protein
MGETKAPEITKEQVIAYLKDLWSESDKQDWERYLTARNTTNEALFAVRQLEIGWDRKNKIKDSIVEALAELAKERARLLRKIEEGAVALVDFRDDGL